MNRFSIKDLERVSGIKAHTIRIWEKRYQIIKPSRTETNIRYYSDDDLRRILNIALLNKYGFKISKIANLDEDQIFQHVTQLTSRTNDFEYFIDRLVIAMMDFNENEFHKIFSQCTKEYGFEKLMTEIIYPLLVKLGILWGINELTPGHEHFIANLIRQKLYSAIENLPPADSSKNRYLLFQHQHELHDIGLLYTHYLLKSKGYPVTFLGTAVPASALLQAYNKIKPKALFTLFVSQLTIEDTDEIINEYCASISKSTTFYIGGNKELLSSIKVHRNVVKIFSIQEMLKHI